MRTKADQISSIRADQRFWRDLAAEVGPDRYAEPGPMGEWSFADMAGHLVGWRNHTIARLEAAGRGEPEPAAPWPSEIVDDDRFSGPDLADPVTINAWIHEQHAGRSPEQLVGDYDASYDRLIAAIEALPDDTSAIRTPSHGLAGHRGGGLHRVTSTRSTCRASAPGSTARDRRTHDGRRDRS